MYLCMYYFIVNAAAGKGKVIPLMNRLRQYLQQKEILGELVKTTAKGDATHLTRIAIKKGYSTIIAIGGDGTVHEVLNGLAGTGATLGIIPMGKNNFLARSLRIPFSWKDAVDTIAARRTMKLDVGKVLEHKNYFLLNVEIGMLPRKKIVRKPFASFFTKNILSHLFRQSPFKVECVLDRTYRLTAKACSISIANVGFSYEELDHLSVEPQDMLLDMVMISPDNTSKNPFGMREDIVHNISHVRGREVYIEPLHKQDVYADGRLIGKTPITVQIAPAPQRVIVGN